MLIHLAGLRVLKHFSQKKIIFSFIIFSLHFPFHLLSSFSSCFFFSFIFSLFFILSLHLSCFFSLPVFSLIFFCLSSSLFSLLFSCISSSLFSLLFFSFLVSPLSSSLVFLSCIVFSCLVLSRLSLFMSFFLCLSFSVFFLCLRVMLCGVCSVVCVVVVVVLLVVVLCVWCVLRHAEKTWKKTVFDFKRLRVHIQNVPCMPAPRAHVLKHVRVVPVHSGTFRMDIRGAGEVIVSSAYQNLPTYGYHELQRFTEETFGSFPFLRFENKSRTTRSRFLPSFAFP